MTSDQFEKADEIKKRLAERRKELNELQGPVFKHLNDGHFDIIINSLKMPIKDAKTKIEKLIFNEIMEAKGEIMFLEKEFDAI